MDELFERARRVPLPHSRVPTLDPADTLVHLGLHGCLSGANRLVWLKDMEQAMSAEELLWDDVVARSRASGADLAVASMLRLARTVIGTPVPDDVMRDLGGSRAWPRLVATAGRIPRLEETTGRRSLLRLTARSTRRDERSSIAALSRRALTALRHPMSRWPHQADRDPDSPTSMYHPAGSRPEFLAAVARNTQP
jgi:hypothetical protein